MDISNNNIKEKQSVMDVIIKPFMFIGFIILLCFGLVYYLLYVLGCFVTRTPNKYKNVIGYVEGVRTIVFHNSPTSPNSDFKKQVKRMATRNNYDSYVSQSNKKEYNTTDSVRSDKKIKKAKKENTKKIKAKKEKKPKQKNYFFQRNIAKMGTFFLKDEIREEKIMAIGKKYPRHLKEEYTYLNENNRAPKKGVRKLRSNEPEKVNFIKKSFSSHKFVSISVSLAVVCVMALIGVMAATDIMPVSITSAFANPAPTTDQFTSIIQDNQENTEVNLENEPTCITEPQEVIDSSKTTLNASEQINELETSQEEIESPQDTTNGETSVEVISGLIETTEDVIKKGDKDEEVKKIQDTLMHLHYMDSDEPTDYYGEQTEYAMELFQRQHGLSVDGIAGSSTLSILYSDEVESYAVSKGDKGYDIKVMQKRLVALDYLSSSFDENGYFDDDTDSAVKSFQRRNDLSADGIVGYRTNQILYDSHAKSAGGSSDGGDSGSTETPDIEPGQDGGSYSSGTGDAIVSKAKSFLGQGIPYVWGGKTTKGFDCSGFVYYVLNHSGVSTGYRTSSAWATSSFSTVSSMDDLEKGDICVFEGHVGIYIGGGEMIDCSSSSNGIRTTNIKSSSYWNRKWVCGKRVAK